jgi:hypothetical protein
MRRDFARSLPSDSPEKKLPLTWLAPGVTRKAGEAILYCEGPHGPALDESRIRETIGNQRVGIATGIVVKIDSWVEGHGTQAAAIQARCTIQAALRARIRP